MRQVVVLVTREGLGQVQTEDRSFGVEMFDRYLHALESRPVKPRAICFYTEGVRLVSSGSPVVMSLKLLEGMGVRVIACRTCLEKYGLLDDLVVGEPGTMNDIVALMDQADSVVTV